MGSNEPGKGFHFHTGDRWRAVLTMKEEWLDLVPESSLESFAGTGNPFMLGELLAGEKVVDVGCGAGTDSVIAAGMVGAEGQVVGVDMTPAMLEKAAHGAEQAGLSSVEPVKRGR